jgi:hypothetical protein
MIGTDMVRSAFWGRWLSRVQWNTRIVQMRVPDVQALRLIVGSMTIAALIGNPSSSHSQTSAADVAAQIRIQGYRCDQPVTATRNIRASRPDSAAWVLRCRNATYRVRLDPNLAARVTKLKKSSH